MDIYYEDAKEAIEKVWADKSLAIDKILESLQGLRDEIENYIDMVEHDIEAQKDLGK